MKKSQLFPGFLRLDFHSGLTGEGYFKRGLTKAAITALTIVLSFGASANYSKILPGREVFKEGPSDQFKLIRGKVVDENGEPLTGVTVQVKGQRDFVLTGGDGSFAISVPDENAVLVFSFTGMLTQEIRTGNKEMLSVVMEFNKTTLSDVVVVGYGTQKKGNITGAVSTVSSDVLNKRATTNTSVLLQGRVPGLQVVQSSGQPGRDNAIMNIRGLGSFGANPAPLVLIDGVIGSLQNLAPNDVESVTVLKDAASASIYGARGANGVILVTTKQGKKGASIDYQLDVAVHNPTRLPKLVTNSAEYMEMYNFARGRNGEGLLYSQQQIDAYKNATDREQYPNFDWLDYYFNPALAVNHYIGLSNATEKGSYKLSMNYLNQDGIMPNINLKRYNAQLNFSNQLTKNIKVGSNIGFMYSDNVEPWINPGFSASIVHGAVYQNAPLYKPFLPDGSGRKTAWAYPNETHDTRAPVVFDDVKNRRNNYAVNAQIYLDVKLMEGLTWSTKGAVNYSDFKSKLRIIETHERYYYHKLPGETDYTLNPGVTFAPEVTDNYGKTIIPTLLSTLSYEKQFGTDHQLGAMAGFEQQESRYSYIMGSRKVFPTNNLDELNAGGTEGQVLEGSGNEWSLRGYFGRLNYAYQGKYLVEFNARYDGTSRVAQPNRWGFFPSVSAGWRISEEKFLQNTGWLNNLKIRGSYGVLGNQEIGLYPYQDILSLTSYTADGGNRQAVLYTRLTDKSLRWESTRVLDLGLDVDLFNGLLGFTFDYFKKNTYDILTTLPVPVSLGLSGPVTNNGELENRGVEIELNHRNKIGSVSYSANFMVSTFRNKLLSIVTPTKGVNEVGLPYNSFYLYEMAGVFQSQDDIDKSPKQIYNNPKPGDIKIKDQNGDGTIDNNDRVSISPYPDFTYSMGFNVGWKGFNLSGFFQGVQGVRTFLSGWGYDPFHQGSSPDIRFRDGWTPDNPTSNIPAVYVNGYQGISGYTNTWNLPDASYLRLKNINLSYTLPRNVLQKLNFKDITVYVSGDNLLTFTKFPGIDPEVTEASNGSMTSVVAGAYPQLRILNGGLKLKF